MRFEDEFFVKVYVRDTVTWKLLPWQARTVFLHLLRKVDRAGIIEFDDEPVITLAALLDLPEEVVSEGLPHLIKRSVIELHPTHTVIPRFVEAQASSQSSTARKAKQRETAAALARHPEVVTIRHEMGQTVTNRDETSRAVTRGHVESRAVTPRIEEIRREEIPPQSPPEGAGGDEPSVELTKAERIERSHDRYCAAYSGGVSSETGATHAVLDARERGVLASLLQAHANGLRGEALDGWLRDNAAAFVRATRDRAGFQAGYAPSAFAKWLNANKPGPVGQPTGFVRRAAEKTPPKYQDLRGAWQAAQPRPSLEGAATTPAPPTQSGREGMPTLEQSTPLEVTRG